MNMVEWEEKSAGNNYIRQEYNNRIVRERDRERERENECTERFSPG